MHQLVVLSSNPLAKHKLTLLRDKNTKPGDFRKILEELTFILAVRASEHLITTPKIVDTPLNKYFGERVKPSMIVPIIRAGIGMVNPLLSLLPDCKMGFMGLSRNEESLKPSQYYCNIPKPQGDEIIFILDPMLATGGSIAYTIKYLIDNGATAKNGKIVVLSILGNMVGINKVIDEYKDVIIYVAELDEKLNDKGFIIPGLGDAGDRIFNTI